MEKEEREEAKAALKNVKDREESGLDGGALKFLEYGAIYYKRMVAEDFLWIYGGR